MSAMEKTGKTPAASAPATAQGTKITIGDLEYDAQQQTLRHGELFASLTLCESKIVAYLFRNHGRQISSEELLRIALGSKTRQKTTIVERHVCSIRKKIAEIEAKTTIRTIRYHGYVIGWAATLQTCRLRFGSVTVKTVPLPGFDLQSISPP